MNVLRRGAATSRWVSLTAMILVFSACTPRNKAYPGPTLQKSQIAVVEPGEERGFSNRFVAILKIDEQDKLEEWVGGHRTPVHLAPGEYRFRVEYKQRTSTTTILIADLIIIISDAVVAAQHEETTIVVPVKAGFTHRVHYRTEDHAYLVTRIEEGAVVTPPALAPPDGAVACVSGEPDRNLDFWCQVIPDVEEQN